MQSPFSKDEGLFSFTAENPRKEQTVSAIDKTQEKEVDKMPEFSGGMEALVAYMIKNVRYSETAVKAKTSGNVLVSFVVTRAGKVSQIKIKKGVSNELDAEAQRVVAAMPDWIPAEKNNQEVDAEVLLSVSFKL